MMTRSGFNISLADYLRHGSSSTLSFFLVFYINYCLLIPRYLFEGRIRQYLLLNTLLIICITTGAHLWQEYTFQNHMRGDDDGQHMGPPKWIFILRDVSTMILTAGLSAAIKLSRRWAQMDAARREAEKSRTESELKNLRQPAQPALPAQYAEQHLRPHRLRCRQGTDCRAGTEPTAAPCAV